MGQLQERIQADLNNTPIGTEKEKRELLKVLLTDIKLKKGNNPSDEDVLPIIKKFKENAIACGNLHEIPILDVYLPQVLNEVQTRMIIQEIIEFNKYTTVKDLGKVMQDIKNVPLNSRVIDNGIASKIAKEILSK